LAPTPPKAYSSLLTVAVGVAPGCLTYFVLLKENTCGLTSSR
jgi:hypothetical protein